ncbi:MAG: hypothetical protein ACOCVK_02610, partial [bacterium]
MARMSLQLRTVESLIEDAACGALVPFPASRPASTSLGESCAFVTDVMHRGVVRCLTFVRSTPDGSLLVVDGGRRLSAFLRVLNGMDWESGMPTIQAFFDPQRAVFDPNPSPASIPVSDPQQLRRDLFTWSAHRAASAGAPGVDDAMRISSALDALLQTSVPVYVGDLEDYDPGKVFDAVNSGGLPITREDLDRATGSLDARRPAAGVSASDDVGALRLCDDDLGEKPAFGWTAPAANAMIVAARRASTDFAAFADRPDVDVEYAVVSSIVCTSLMFPLGEVRDAAERLIRLIGRGMNELPESLSDRAVSTEIPRVRDALRELRPAALLDETALAELERGLRFLTDLAYQLSPGPHELPALHYSGAFLVESTTLDGVTFGPGVYVSDSDDGCETVRHELAHAYMHEHKSRLIHCPWIEEGLAEYLARCTGDSSAGHPAPSSARYYHYLWHLLSLDPSAVRRLLDEWLDGEAGCEHWMTIVDDYYARYAAEVHGAAGHDRSHVDSTA